MVRRTFLFGSMTNSERTVAVADISGWIMSYSVDTLRSVSAMMGKPTTVCWVASMSLIQLVCDSAGSTDSAIALTLRLSNSGLSLAVRPSSVVQTGVKSAGCENSTTQELPAHSWKWMVPMEESCVKSGAVSPRRMVIVISVRVEPQHDARSSSMQSAPSRRRIIYLCQLRHAAPIVRPFRQQLQLLLPKQPLAQPALGIDMAERAAVDEVAAPAARPKRGLFQTHPRIVGAGDHDRRAAKVPLRQPGGDAELVRIGRRDQQHAGHLRRIGRDAVCAGKAAEAVGDDQRRAPVLPARCAHARRPGRQIRHLPVVLPDAFETRIQALPAALPMFRPAVVQAGGDQYAKLAENTRGHGRPPRLFRLVNLVEHAAVGEVGFLRLAPVAGHVGQREQFDRRELRRIFLGLLLDGRAVIVLGDQLLRFVGVEEVQIRLGHL